MKRPPFADSKSIIFFTEDFMKKFSRILGMPTSILEQLAAAPGAKPELKILAKFAVRSRQIHSERVRIAGLPPLRKKKLAAALQDQPSQADAVRRLRLAQLNASH